MQSVSKYQWHFLVKYKNSSTIHVGLQKTLNSLSDLDKKDNTESIVLFDFKYITKLP